jgi:prepilin-type N-terminal cleavage/methylation domain-containing protein
MVVLNRKGFTLIELLVVISIIATLTAILLPNFMGARERATDSSKKQGLVAIKNALRLFYNDTQNYPPTQDMAALGTTLAPYMPSISGIGFTYSYYQTNSGDGFQLCVGVDSGGNEVSTSQAQCKDASNQVCQTTISSSLKLFVVCAN